MRKLKKAGSNYALTAKQRVEKIAALEHQIVQEQCAHQRRLLVKKSKYHIHALHGFRYGDKRTKLRSEVLFN